MPILHGDRLIGRIDPRFDRATGVLDVNAVFAEPDAPASAGPSVARSIRELASWLGASDVGFTRTRADRVAVAPDLRSPLSHGRDLRPH